MKFSGFIGKLITNTDFGIIGILALFFLIYPNLQPELRILQNSLKDNTFVNKRLKIERSGEIIIWDEVNLKVKNASIKRGYIDSVHVRIQKLNLDQYTVRTQRLTRNKIGYFKVANFQFDFIVSIKNREMVDSSEVIELTFFDNFGNPVYFDESGKIATLNTKRFFYPQKSM